MKNIRDFSGKVVLITGAGGGIGSVTAVEFAKSGAQVVITDINAGKLSEVAKECTKVSPKGLNALEVVADICKEDDCKRLIHSMINTLGKLDILVNIAGLLSDSPIRQENIMQTYDRLMSTNVRSVVYLTYLSVEHLEKSKGNIINISSNSGFKPFSQLFVYCMSKSALDMLTKCLALELGPKGIRVNAINPGNIRTDIYRGFGMDDKQMDDVMSGWVKTTPLGRIGDPIDIANTILFLASDESSFMTGINFVSDGGRSLSC